MKRKVKEVQESTRSTKELKRQQTQSKPRDGSISITGAAMGCVLCGIGDSNQDVVLYVKTGNFPCDLDRVIPDETLLSCFPMLETMAELRDWQLRHSKSYASMRDMTFQVISFGMEQEQNEILLVLFADKSRVFGDAFSGHLFATKFKHHFNRECSLWDSKTWKLVAPPVFLLDQPGLDLADGKFKLCCPLVATLEANEQQLAFGLPDFEMPKTIPHPWKRPMHLYRKFFELLVQKSTTKIDNHDSIESFLLEVFRSVEGIISPYWDATSKVSRSYMEHVLIAMAMAMAKFSAHEHSIQDIHCLLSAALLARKTPVWTPTDRLVSAWAAMFERAIKSPRYRTVPVLTSSLDRTPRVWTQDLPLNLLFLGTELGLTEKDITVLFSQSQPLQDKKDLAESMSFADCVDFRRDAPWAVYLDRSAKDYDAWFASPPPKSVKDQWLRIMDAQNNMSTCMHVQDRGWKQSKRVLESGWIAYLLGHHRVFDQFYWCLNPSNLMEILVLKTDSRLTMDEYHQVCKHARHQLIQGMELERSPYHDKEEYRLVFVPADKDRKEPEWLVFKNTIKQTLTEFLTVTYLEPNGWSNEKWQDLADHVRQCMRSENSASRSRLRQIIRESTQDIKFPIPSLTESEHGQGGAYRIFRSIKDGLERDYNVICEQSPLSFSIPKEFYSVAQAIKDNILTDKQITKYEITDRNRMVLVAENTVHDIIPTDEDLRQPFDMDQDSIPVLLTDLVVDKPMIATTIRDQLLQVIKQDNVQPIRHQNAFLSGFITDLDGNMKQCDSYQGLEIAIWRDPARKDGVPSLYPHGDTKGPCWMEIIVFLRFQNQFFPCGTLVISGRDVLRAKDGQVMEWIKSQSIQRDVIMLLHNTFVTLIGRVHKPEIKSVILGDKSISELLEEQTHRRDPVAAMFQKMTIKHDVYLSRVSRLSEIERKDFPKKPRWEWIREKQIEKGAYGTVYACSRLGDSQKYVLKMAQGQPKSAKAILAMMIAGEAGISPKLIDYWTEYPQTLCFVMEFVPGIQFEKMLVDNGALHMLKASSRAWIAFREKLEALGMQGISHDDLHPGNVMIHQDPKSNKLVVKIIDMDNPRLVHMNLQYTAAQRCRVSFPFHLSSSTAFVD